MAGVVFQREKNQNSASCNSSFGNITWSAISELYIFILSAFMIGQKLIIMGIKFKFVLWQEIAFNLTNILSETVS